MDVHRTGIAGIVIFPDRFEHLFSAEHSAAIGYEHLEQVKFLGCQLDVFSAKGNAPLDQVHFHIVDPDHPVFLLLDAAGNTAEDRLDPRFDFKNIEGFGHIIIRAVFKPEDLIHILTLGGQHDDRNITAFTDPLADSNTVQFRQHNVQKDKVKRPCFKLGQGFLAIHGAVCFVAFLLQRIFQAFQDQRLVIHKEDPFTH